MCASIRIVRRGLRGSMIASECPSIVALRIVGYSRYALVDLPAMTYPTHHLSYRRHQALHATRSQSNICQGCRKTFSRLDALNVSDHHEVLLPWHSHCLDLIHLLYDSDIVSGYLDTRRPLVYEYHI